MAYDYTTEKGAYPEFVPASSVTDLLSKLRWLNQQAMRRERMAQPRVAPAQDSRSRRTGEAVDELIIGSPDRCDITSAIVASYVVRSS
jgi:hypothetical protein